jgi:hypothetical protein
MNWRRVFHQDFQQSAPDVDRSIWESPHWQPANNPAFYGRTGIRNPKDFPGPDGLIPCTVQNGAALRLSTYNPKAPNHDTFLGSDIYTKQTWGANGETVRFEATVQCPAMPGGAVTSLFSYNLITKQPTKPGDLRNEIDFEFASNHWTDSPPGSTRTSTVARTEAAQEKWASRTLMGSISRTSTHSVLTLPQRPAPAADIYNGL